MIGVKEAVAAAIAAAKDFYADSDIHGLELEEVARSEDNTAWLITLSFLIPDATPAQSTGAMAQILAGMRKSERKYKVFRIDVGTGRVLSMKILNQ